MEDTTIPKMFLLVRNAAQKLRMGNNKIFVVQGIKRCSGCERYSIDIGLTSDSKENIGGRCQCGQGRIIAPKDTLWYNWEDFEVIDTQQPIFDSGFFQTLENLGK